MKCAKCKTINPPGFLHRINSYGEAAEWWCETCIKIHEPELYHNIMCERTAVEKVILDLLHVSTNSRVGLFDERCLYISSIISRYMLSRAAL